MTRRRPARRTRRKAQVGVGVRLGMGFEVTDGASWGAHGSWRGGSGCAEWERRGYWSWADACCVKRVDGASDKYRSGVLVVSMGSSLSAWVVLIQTDPNRSQTHHATDNQHFLRSLLAGHGTDDVDTPAEHVPGHQRTEHLTSAEANE